MRKFRGIYGDQQSGIRRSCVANHGRSTKWEAESYEQIDRDKCEQSLN